MSAPKRNDPCPCGSGKKYKQCCLKREATSDKQSESSSIPVKLQEALAHQQAGRLVEAEAIYQQILQLQPDHPDALHLLGLIAHQLGENEVAFDLIGKAISLNPSEPVYYSNLGVSLDAQGKLEAAAESYRVAISLKPDYVEAHYNLGNVFKAQGRLDEAIAEYQRALSFKPDYVEALGSLGFVLKEQGRLDAAVEYLHKALALRPDYAEAHNDLGNALRDQGKRDEAVESYRKALAFKPDFASAYGNLGLVLCELGKPAEAIESLSRALALKPDFPEALNNMGGALEAQGKIAAAVECYSKALVYKPDYTGAYDNLLYLCAYHAVNAPAEYLSLARGWELACIPEGERQAARRRAFTREPLAGRRLKVGYVSGDFRNHAVSYFVSQLFAHHDRSRVELFAYSTYGQRDAVTEKLQAEVEHWVSLAGISDAAAVERIEADGIDVLVDLSGHTAHNRLGIFARRGAPVQVHYLGYFASTGLTEMDYFIGDEILTPLGTDGHFSEEVWRLPRIWISYEGKDEAPLPGWQPARDDTVLLGSFNNLAKLTPATLELWAQVLHALPEGRLLLKTKDLADAGNRQRILEAMANHGIPAERIELQPASITPGWQEHMGYYDRLDIALDPIGGVGGGTTTCDALWMGVPVVALEGDRMASRMTASMLHAIGHPEWITRTEEEYREKVVALARDVAGRKSLRFEQRDRMRASSLCDAGGLAAQLERAYFDMFEQWLGKQGRKGTL